MISEPIEFIGAHNVAADLHGAHGMATLDQIRAWNPEVIITSNKDFAASVAGNPNWAAIAAVEASHRSAISRQKSSRSAGSIFRRRSTG